MEAVSKLLQSVSGTVLHEGGYCRPLPDVLCCVVLNIASVLLSVFDMTGFGLSNMDWDTATMVINIFQSYYPETLGHAIVWNAPTVFSAVWKIVKPMLDPVVREKVAFCNNAKEIEKVSLPCH